MRIDTHVHFLVSKEARPNWEEIKFATEVARYEGLSLLCICEHLDAIYYPELMDGLFIKRLLGGDLIEPGVLRLSNGLILSCGAEVSIEGGGDIGIHASVATILSLNRSKGAYSLQELLSKLSESSDTTLAVAHHVYWPRKWIENLSDSAPQLDAIELPAKDLSQTSRYDALGHDLKLPIIGGGDAHTWLQIGTCYSEVPLDESEFSGREILKSLMQQRRLMAVPLADASRRVKLSGLLRSHIELMQRSM